MKKLLQVHLSRWSFGAWMLLLLICSGCGGPELFEGDKVKGKAEVSFFKLKDRTLHIETDRYKLEVKEGLVVSIFNKLTNEQLSKASNLQERLPYSPLGMGVWNESLVNESHYRNFHEWTGEYGTWNKPLTFVRRPTQKSKLDIEQVDSRRMVLKYTGLGSYDAEGKELFFPEDSYEIEFCIEPESQDLEIQAVARSAESKDVYAVGVGFAEIDPNLEVILPIKEGISFVPSQAKVVRRQTGQWPKPYVASLMVAESSKGSMSIWVEEPKLKDRYFHWHQGPNQSFDYYVNSINLQPFGEDSEAISRPVRFNVFDGGWTKAAKPFREWWATEFDVPLWEERLQEVQDITWHASFAVPHFPKGYEKNCLFFTGQTWKTNAPRGDHGLFPDDPKEGPVTTPKFDREFKVWKEKGVKEFVYVNLNHMDKRHPWADQFKPYWVNRKLFVDDTKDPVISGYKSFTINTSYKPWQDLLLWWIDEAKNRYGINGYYIDVAYGIANGGQVDGKAEIEGMVEFYQRARKRQPKAYWGAEYISEATAIGADFAGIGLDNWFGCRDFENHQAWMPRLKAMHPINGFIYNPYIRGFAYQPSPITPALDETLGRLAHGRMLMNRPPKGANMDYTATSGFAEFWLKFTGDGARPHYPDHRWPKNVRMYYKDKAENIHTIYSDNGLESRMVAPDGEVSYWSIIGRHRADLPSGKGIDGWLAYDDRGAIGLNPNGIYFYQGAERHRDWRVSKLPEGSFVKGFRPYASGVLVMELEALDNFKAGEVELFSEKAITRVMVAGRSVPASVQALPEGGFVMRVRVEQPGSVVFINEKTEVMAVNEKGETDLSATDLTQAYSAISWNGLRRIPKRALRFQGGPRKQIAITAPHKEMAFLDLPVEFSKASDLKLQFTHRRVRSGWAEVEVLLNGVPVGRSRIAKGEEDKEVSFDLNIAEAQTAMLSFKVKSFASELVMEKLRLTQK